MSTGLMGSDGLGLLGLPREEPTRAVQHKLSPWCNCHFQQEVQSLLNKLHNQIVDGCQCWRTRVRRSWPPTGTSAPSATPRWTPPRRRAADTSSTQTASSNFLLNFTHSSFFWYNLGAKKKTSHILHFFWYNLGTKK